MQRTTLPKGTPLDPDAPNLASDPLPFAWALAETAYSLAPGVQQHVFQQPGTVVTYRGRMRVWREPGWRGVLAGWLLRLGIPTRTMFPETGDSVDFRMTHRVALESDSSISMTWQRSFDFGNVVRHFDATMFFVKDHAPIVDWRGALNRLHVELHPTVQDGSIVVTSCREWFDLGLLRVPIPHVLKGRPFVRESQEPGGSLRIHVEIHNSLLGQVFGYEGTYQREPETPESPRVDALE